MFQNILKLVVLELLLFYGVADAMTRQQLKNSGKMMKKSCMPKNDVTEEQVGDIEKGHFIEERNVMCYVACIYSMSQLVKNNKLNYESVIKQVDMMFPPELREPTKAAAEKCKDVGECPTPPLESLKPYYKTKTKDSSGLKPELDF